MNAVLRYDAGVVRLTESEIKIIDQKTRKIQNKLYTLHVKSYMGQLDVEI